MNNKLKILAISDTHGDSRLVKKLAIKADQEEVNAILLCGDIVGWRETKDIIAPLIKKDRPLLFIPGNHEDVSITEELISRYNLVNMHGQSLKIGEVGIFGIGGADLLPGFVSEKTIYSELVKSHSIIKDSRKKVLMTHMHPKDSKSEFSGIEGSNAIKRIIEKFSPDIVLHGHIHEAAGFEERWNNTRIVNVGRKGFIFEI